MSPPVSDSGPVCVYCNVPVVVDDMGVWQDPGLRVACTLSPTGFHHPEGAQAVAEATGEPLNVAAINMPPGTMMYVIALTTGSYYTSISFLDPEGPMGKVEAAAMLHQIAAGWENDAALDIAQTN
jgi:hypothetical protein